MKHIFKNGDKKSFVREVKEEHTAIFDEEKVHPVYATFSIARDAEWTSRLFVLDMKEEDEEGVGTMILVDHISPAKIGEEVAFTSKIKSISGNEIICDFVARVGDRVIAQGVQGQKILKKDRINQIFGNN